MIRVFKNSPVPIREHKQRDKRKFKSPLTLKTGEAEFSGTERSEKN